MQQHATTRRYPRTLAEAFVCERYPAVFGPYRRPTARVWAALQIAATLALWAGIGVLLAWRG